ncbi:MAG: AMP-binding protein [Myxococcales bacterium]|nr:AMP-binding protein [Myxococcales bacterium]
MAARRRPRRRSRPCAVPGSARAGRRAAAAGPVHRVDAATPPGPGPAAPERFWALDEVRWLVATSGTTGAARLVPLHVGQIVFSTFGALLRLGHAPGERWLACLPLHHVGGLALLMRVVLAAGTIEVRPFDAATVAARLDAGAVHRVSLTPSLWQQVLDARPARPFPAALRCVLLGGEACPPALVTRSAALGAPVSLTWGLTEAASQVCTRVPGDLDPAGGVGAPLAFARVAPGPDGALAIRGPLVAGDAEVTQDVGRVDAAGRVHVEGRRDAVIVSGGVKIDGAALEAALAAHPAVADAAVVALPDVRHGQRPGALVVPAGEARPEAELRAWCRAQVGRYAAPDRLIWRPALPRTGPLGKVDRAAIRTMLLEEGPP